MNLICKILGHNWYQINKSSMFPPIMEDGVIIETTIHDFHCIRCYKAQYKLTVNHKRSFNVENSNNEDNRISR